MTLTARGICEEALGDLMVLGVGQNMGAAEASIAFRKLNNLMDASQSQSLFCFGMTRTTWNIAASTVSYPVGSGLTINVNRPQFVDGVSYIDTANSPTVEIQLIPFTDWAFQANSVKPLTSNLPVNYFYNITTTGATLSLYPIPTSTTLQGVFYARTQITEFASLDTVILLPYGWKRYLVSNLAVECAAAFEREPSQALKDTAARSLADLKRSNIRLVDAHLDAGALIGSRRGGYSYWDFVAGTF